MSLTLLSYVKTKMDLFQILWSSQKASTLRLQFHEMFDQSIIELKNVAVNLIMQT